MLNRRLSRLCLSLGLANRKYEKKEEEDRYEPHGLLFCALDLLHCLVSLLLRQEKSKQPAKDLRNGIS
jgi:hypothetical protein